jgi:5-hydroxyisourate hydrolase-like protein (transthyretin family)
MSRHSILSVVVFALVTLVLMSTPRTTRACMCPMIEPDVAYQNASIVFTGTVDKITELTRETPREGQLAMTSDGRIVRIAIEEYFKGTGDSEIELRGENTSCDIHFETGKRYIVYASQNAQTGALGAFSCSRTRLLEDYAKPDLSYLRRIKRGERPTMLYGFAFKNSAESATRGQPEPLGELTVTIEGEGKRLELKTDARGYFETFDLQPGNYRISTGVTGKLRGGDAQTVDLRTIASVMFRTTTMGSLSGKVMDKEGRPPFAGLQIELLRAGENSGRALTYVNTNEDGTFVFHELLAGRYLLAVNSLGQRSLYGAPFVPSYFPKASSRAEAQVITIADGVSVEAGEFILQERYPTIALRGIVVTEDGKPIPGAYVNLSQSGGGWDAARAVQTDVDGRFVHQVFEGVTYTVNSHGDAPSGGALQSDPVEVTATRSEKPVRIVLKGPR